MSSNIETSPKVGKTAIATAPSRSTLSRQRKRAGLMNVWISREQMETLALESGLLKEWDLEDIKKVETAIQDYIKMQVSRL